MRNAIGTTWSPLALAVALGVAGTSGALAEGGQAPLPPTSLLIADTAYDWSGAYAGLGISRHAGAVGPNGFIALEDTTAGTAFAGYAFQTGQFVYGVELAYSHFDQDYVIVGVFGDPRMSNALDASIRLGYAFDNVLAYAVAGPSRLESFVFGPSGPQEEDATGFHHGLGIAYGINDRFDVSLQYITRDLTYAGGPGNPDVDVEHQTFSLRAAFRF